MTNAALRGKPDAGNPHVRFDEGEVAPAATPRRGSLLYNKAYKSFTMTIGMLTMTLRVGAGPSVAEIVAEHMLTGAQKEISRTLDDAKSPYTVVGEYFVGSGMELIVKEGVTLIFKKNAGFSIQGGLKMEGTVECPIVCKGSSSGIGIWQGIKICKDATADIEGVSISGAKCGLSLQKKVYVRKCSICKNECGIVASDSVLEDLYICDNRGDAIGVGHPTVDHCTISRNGGNGLCGWGGCNITKSVIYRNKKSGVNCWNGGHDVTITKSYLAENKKFDVHNGCDKTWDCSENYWGAAITKMLDYKGDVVNLPRIYDRKDNPGIGIVDISKWLKEMPIDCGAREYPGMKPKKSDSKD